MSSIVCVLGMSYIYKKYTKIINFNNITIYCYNNVATFYNNEVTSKFMASSNSTRATTFQENIDNTPGLDYNYQL